MKVRNTPLKDVKLIEHDVFEDARGFFLETWSSSAFDEIGLGLEFVQDNYSRSARGVLRGMHYQVRNTQGKLVRCVRGSVFDVAIDLRRSSPTFGGWFGVELTEANKLSMWIPPGFAHGFLTLSDRADFFYKCTQPYDPESERTLCWDDESVGVRWPGLGGEGPSLSEKDLKSGVGIDAADLFE